MFKRLLALVAALISVGCATGPITIGPDPLVSHLRQLAGPGALDCGTSPLVRVSNPMRHQRTVVKCAEAAIADGKSFWAAFQQMGEDSALWEGVSRTPAGQLLVTNYDSDIYGGSRSFAAPRSDDKPCSSVGFGDGYYGIVICRVGP